MAAGAISFGENRPVGAGPAPGRRHRGLGAPHARCLPLAGATPLTSTPSTSTRSLEGDGLPFSAWRPGGPKRRRPPPLRPALATDGGPACTTGVAESCSTTTSRRPSSSRRTTRRWLASRPSAAKSSASLGGHVDLALGRQRVEPDGARSRGIRPHGGPAHRSRLRPLSREARAPFSLAQLSRRHGRTSSSSGAWRRTSATRISSASRPTGSAS